MALLLLGMFLLGALPAPGLPTDSVPLYEDLGTHHVAITTRVPKAQRYFDQGMRLVYGFNHGEAIRAFTEAARLDPNCPMCYWGIAYAHGPHVNAGIDSAAGVAAYAAAQQALSLASRVTPRERAYIRAVAKRYAAPPPADRAPLDSAYARAMGDVVRQYPNDLDAATLYAESLMDLRPWNYWNQQTSEPYPGTTEIVAQLERVLQANPNHPGACHYYIHAVEAVQPEKAVPCAERLAALMPGAGHMVHMPAHIYIRVGRYGDAIEANVHFAATIAGHSAQAIEAAKKTGSTTPPEVARQVPPVEPYVTYPLLTLTTFGRWDDVLALPLPPSDLRFSTAIAHYARGVAFAAKGQWTAAQVALDTVKQIAATTNPRYAEAGWVTPKTVLEIASHALMGEIAARRGQLNEGIAHFQAAARIEDGMQYIEPPDWYYPIRHSLGAVLLKAGRAAEAEMAYREDLKRFPDNGWSLFGLAQALRAQAKAAEAVEIDQRFQRAWAIADIALRASRF